MRATPLAYEPTSPNELLVLLNRRNKRDMDVYRLNLTTGALDQMAENPGNVGQWINSGLGDTPDARNRNAEFSERGPVSRKELVDRIVRTLGEADATLARFDPWRLLEVRNFQVYEVTCLDAISHVVEHFSQHLGQVIYITKLRKGIDLRFYDL